MKQSGFSVLTVVFLLLCLHTAQPGRKRVAVNKTGYCPRREVDCYSTLLPLCKFDNDCKKVKKCCFYSCRYRCMEPFLSLDKDRTLPFVG